MSRNVFIALAAIMGVVVGLPQHRYQPYQFSFMAGKQDSVTGHLNSAGSINLPIKYEEHTPVQNKHHASPVKEDPPMDTNADQTVEIGQMNHLWHKAAKNLVNIPHLLRWVSSLNPETLMDTLNKQQERSPEPQQSIPKSPQQTNPTLGQSRKNGPIVEKETQNYDPNYLTEKPKTVEKEVKLSHPRLQTAPRASDPKIATQRQKYESKHGHQPEDQHQPEPSQQQHTRQENIPNEREISLIKPQPTQITVDQSPLVEKQVKKVVPTRPQSTVEADTNIPMVVATHHQHIEQKPHHEVEPVNEAQKHHFPQKGRTEQVQHRESNRQHQQPIVSTFEKTTIGSRKKSFFKFKNNKHGISKRLQSLKRGKTLIHTLPLPAPRQESIFSLDSFTFPAYSYSVSHTPSHTFYTGR